MKLSKLLQQDQFTSASQEAVLNVMATESWINSVFTDMFGTHGITRQQYNVLRILRGSHPSPLACSAISERLIDRMPDVTRLLVRLEREELIRRSRAKHDRRVVEVSITQKGLDVLDRLDGPVEERMVTMTQHLTKTELATLSTLLEKFRTDQDA